MLRQSRSTLLLLSLVFPSGLALAQSNAAGTPPSANAYKVAVLPFADTTGNLSEKTSALAKILQAELSHSSDLETRFVKPVEDSGSDIDSTQALSISREHKSDVVVVTTVLSAQEEESEHNAQGPSLFGQSLGGSSHSAKATVEIQAEIYDTTTGKQLDSIRVQGVEHANKVSGQASTSFGILGNDGQSPSSPLEKAVRKAIHSLAERIAADKNKMQHYQPPAGTMPAPGQPDPADALKQ